MSLQSSFYLGELCFIQVCFSVNQNNKLSRKMLHFIYLPWLLSPTQGRINHFTTPRLRALCLLLIVYKCNKRHIYPFSWYCNNEKTIYLYSTSRLLLNELFEEIRLYFYINYYTIIHKSNNSRLQYIYIFLNHHWQYDN